MDPLPDTPAELLTHCQRIKKGLAENVGKGRRVYTHEESLTLRMKFGMGFKEDDLLPRLRPIWEAMYVMDRGDVPSFPGEPTSANEAFAGLNTAIGWCQAVLACQDTGRADADPAGQQNTSPTNRPARQRKARRRATARAPRPLTGKETEAMQLVGEHKGNIAAAARAAGKSRAAMSKLYKKATAKLGKKAIKHFTQRLPKDNRGQETIAAEENE
jgi:hypothetical protein